MRPREVDAVRGKSGQVVVGQDVLELGAPRRPPRPSRAGQRPRTRFRPRPSVRGGSRRRGRSCSHRRGCRPLRSAPGRSRGEPSRGCSAPGSRTRHLATPRASSRWRTRRRARPRRPRHLAPVAALVLDEVGGGRSLGADGIAPETRDRTPLTGRQGLRRCRCSLGHASELTQRDWLEGDE